MKSRIVLLALVTVLSIVGLEAQGLKIGYADANYILSLMPEAEQAQADITSHEKMIQTRLQAKYQDYQTKLASYQENVGSYEDIIRQEKETELRALQESIQSFEADAQNSIAKKQNELLQPLFQKIGEAIKSAAEENNYDFILSAGAQGVDVLLYAKEDKNMTNLVLAKLGIDPPADN